jgi:spore germination cell wall hydrolase CwlJ-like protein
MVRKTYRVGAIASTTLLFATLLGTGLSGAIAQDQAEPAELETVNTEISTSNEVPAQQIRFVSAPVVQPVAEAEAADADNGSSLQQLVSSMAVEDNMSDDMRCLAQAVYFESRGEPLDGQLAVARVVINRTESNQFPDNYCSVVTQRAQFSFVRGGNIPNPNTSSEAWQRAKAIARIAHQEMWDSEASDALYFHAHYVSPRWARTKVARARIDSHIFYR